MLVLFDDIIFKYFVVFGTRCALERGQETRLIENWITAPQRQAGRTGRMADTTTETDRQGGEGASVILRLERSRKDKYHEKDHSLYSRKRSKNLKSRRYIGTISGQIPRCYQGLQAVNFNTRKMDKWFRMQGNWWLLGRAWRSMWTWLRFMAFSIRNDINQLFRALWPGYYATELTLRLERAEGEKYHAKEKLEIIRYS